MTRALKTFLASFWLALVGTTMICCYISPSLGTGCRMDYYDLYIYAITKLGLSSRQIDGDRIDRARSHTSICQ